MVRPGSRIEVAQGKLREYLSDNPNASLNQGLRWLNNQRVAGQTLTLMPGEARWVFDQMRNPPAGQKKLPIEVKPADVREPLKVPLALLAHPPPPQSPPIDIPVVPKPLLDETVARSDSPEGRALRVRWLEGHSLEHPTLNSNEVLSDMRKRFGIGVDSRLVVTILRQVRDAAGLPPPKFVHRPPKEKEPVPDLVKPTDTTDPNDLLKGAGLKLKHLCALMKWSKVSLTVNADGTMGYDATPAPVMAMKGEIKL